MRQYVLDDEGLRELLLTAWKHGYSDGLEQGYCIKDAKSLNKNHEKMMKDYVITLPVGEIIEGRIPYAHFS